MIPIIDSVLDIAKRFIPDEDKKLELDKAILEHKTELENKFFEYARLDSKLRMKEIELTGFKASWRPYVMFSFSTVIVIYCILYYLLPAVLIFFPSLDYITLLEPPKVDPALWDLVKYSILGIGGLS